MGSKILQSNEADVQKKRAAQYRTELLYKASPRGRFHYEPPQDDETAVGFMLTACPPHVCSLALWLPCVEVGTGRQAKLLHLWVWRELRLSICSGLLLPDWDLVSVFFPCRWMHLLWAELYFSKPVDFSSKFCKYQLLLSLPLALIWSLQPFDVYLGSGVTALVVLIDQSPLAFLWTLQNPN